MDTIERILTTGIDLEMAVAQLAKARNSDTGFAYREHLRLAVHYTRNAGFDDTADRVQGIASAIPVLFEDIDAVLVELTGRAA